MIFDAHAHVVRRFIDEAIGLFGGDRLLYGGGWPISDPRGGCDGTS